MNKKGFISTSVIFAFFITFLMLLVIIITSYAQNRVLMNQVKKDVKNNLVIKYNFNEVSEDDNSEENQDNGGNSIEDGDVKIPVVDDEVNPEY